MTRKERRRRKNLRDKARAETRQDYQVAQRAYEKAKALDLPTAEKLRLARDRALGKFKRADRYYDIAARKLRDSAPVDPERTRISPNRSSRGGVKPRLLVLHITVSHNRPGLADLDGILSFFQNPATQASSHIVIDREGHDGRCVRDADKAWTQAAYNPQSLSIELIEFNHLLTRKEWLSKERGPQLECAAKWLAHWSHLYGIPLRESRSSGVCQHRDLGAAGGGHVDCSPGFPIDHVITRAKQIREARFDH